MDDTTIATDRNANDTIHGWYNSDHIDFEHNTTYYYFLKIKGRFTEKGSDMVEHLTVSSYLSDERMEEKSDTIRRGGVTSALKSKYIYWLNLVRRVK